MQIPSIAGKILALRRSNEIPTVDSRAISSSSDEYQRTCGCKSRQEGDRESALEAAYVQRKNVSPILKSPKGGLLLPLHRSGFNIGSIKHYLK